MAHRAFDVYLFGRVIDTVFMTGYTAEEAYRSLVNHDGYNAAIRVYRRAEKPTAKMTYDDEHQEGG